MFEQRRWVTHGWIPVTAGLLWLWSAAAFGLIGFLFSVVPGCLLLAAGISTLLYPGDPRIPQFIAAGGLLGVPFSVPAFFVSGFATGAVLLLASIVAFVTSGWVAVFQEPHEEDVPEPVPSLKLAAQVAVDNVLLAGVAVRAPMVSPAEYRRVKIEVDEALDLFQARGWLDNPASYHRTPPALDSPRLVQRRAGALDFEHLSFASEYEPWEGEPGRDRWASFERNRRAHAWVLRRAADPRRWLVCIHGYEMGFPRIDLHAFQAPRFHFGYQLNIACPVLPLHGPRRKAWQSGQGYLAADFLDTIHAEAQAIWDIRRLLSWIRAQGAERIGVYGLSLGGYNTALLSCFEDGLACVVAGIPATDFARLTWRHGPPLQIRYAERQGLEPQSVDRVLQVVSPLVLRPRVPLEHRYIFAAVSDLLVPPDQPRDLWRHWERPTIEWYQGAHVTFRAHSQVNGLLLRALRSASLIEGPAGSAGSGSTPAAAGQPC